MNLDIKLKSFIPFYLPVIGEVDAFIKVNRPDNLFKDIGLTVMDESTTKRIDKYILETDFVDFIETTKTKIDQFSVKSIKEPKKIK